jgi:hypothetical protein
MERKMNDGNKSDQGPNDPGPKVQAEPGQVPAPSQSKAIWMRLLYMVLVAIMSGLAQTALHLMALVQFIVLLTGKGQRNDQIAAFGKAMGEWQANAARFQTAESEDKPWPWSPLP